MEWSLRPVSNFTIFCQPGQGYNIKRYFQESQLENCIISSTFFNYWLLFVCLFLRVGDGTLLFCPQKELHTNHQYEQVLNEASHAVGVEELALE